MESRIVRHKTLREIVVFAEERGDEEAAKLIVLVAMVERLENIEESLDRLASK